MLSLRKLRERRGLTQEELAELATIEHPDGSATHLDQTTVSALERGINLDPKKSTIEALARGLRCNVIDVWHGINQSIREAAHAGNGKR